MIFVVNRANAVSSIVVRPPVTWNMAVPPDDTTLAYASQCHTLDMHAYTRAHMNALPPAPQTIAGWVKCGSRYSNVSPWVATKK